MFSSECSTSFGNFEGSFLKKIGKKVKKNADFLSPVTMAAKVANKTGVVKIGDRNMDYLRLTSPLSVPAIKNRNLKKKAMIGYGAAAAVAGGIAAAGAMGTGAAGAGAAAATPNVVPTIGSAAATGSTTVGTASKVVKALNIANTASSFMKKDGSEDTEEIAQEQSIPESPIFAGMVTTKNVLLFMGLSALTLAGYLFFNKPTKG